MTAHLAMRFEAELNRRIDIAYNSSSNRPSLTQPPNAIQSFVGWNFGPAGAGPR